jgi:hypothetical protein
MDSGKETGDRRLHYVVHRFLHDLSALRTDLSVSTNVCEVVMRSQILWSTSYGITLPATKAGATEAVASNRPFFTRQVRS